MQADYDNCNTKTGIMKAVTVNNLETWPSEKTKHNIPK